uniref:Retrotransposon Copia-like N-terminal domain-containing protein n=1 Tax=Salix viminalis TaxID=40686 RepID=A0A6N2KCL1_SALVM
MVSERLLANASTDSMSIIKDSASSAALHLPAQVISVKLDGTNFLAWSAQLLPLFRSYGLMGIVDGSEPSPPQFSSPENQTQGIRDSGYVIWQYKDQTILGWIISSLSPGVVSTIYGLETSRLAWQALGARFAAPSTSRISLLKRKLQSLQQGSMQCQQFLDAVKSLADELSAVGKPIDDSDLILSVLNGLNSSFHSFVTTYMLLAKEKSMSFSDFHAELLNFDLMQKFHSQTIQQETGSYAFYSHKPGSRSNFRGNNKTRFNAPLKGSSSVPSPRHPDQEIQTLATIPPNSIAPPVAIDPLIPIP